MSNLKKAFRRRPWLFIIIIIYAVGMTVVSVPKSMDLTKDSDLWSIRQAGRDFYEKNELYERREERPYYYPPFSAFIWQPLYAMPLKYAGVAVFLLNALVLLPLSVYLLYQTLLNVGVNARRAETALILATIFTLKYFWYNLVMFQINYIILAVVLAAVYYLSLKKPHLAGVLVTIITFIKVIPVIFAAYVFLFHFSRKVVLSMVLTLVFCLTLPISMRGWDQWKRDHVDFYEILVGQYVVEGRIVADQANHSLKAGFIKTFYPETRGDENVAPGDYPGFVKAMNFMTILLLLTLVTGGVVLYRRNTHFSLSYLSAILLFTHLLSGITWTAHLVTLIFCLLPVLLIDVNKLTTGGKVAYWAFIALMIFLGIEGSDTVGEKIYLAIRIYDIYTYLLMGLFIFCSWAVIDKRSPALYPPWNKDLRIKLLQPPTTVFITLRPLRDKTCESI